MDGQSASRGDFAGGAHGGTVSENRREGEDLIFGEAWPGADGQGVDRLGMAGLGYNISGVEKPPVKPNKKRKEFFL